MAVPALTLANHDWHINFATTLERYPSIWNVGSLPYRNRVRKAKAWRDMAKELSIGEEAARTKYNSMRTQFTKQSKLFRDGKKSGANGAPLKKWWLYDVCLFMEPTTTPRPGISNWCQSTSSSNDAGAATNPSSSNGAGAGRPTNPSSSNGAGAALGAATTSSASSPSRSSSPGRVSPSAHVGLPADVDTPGEVYPAVFSYAEIDPQDLLHAQEELAREIEREINMDVDDDLDQVGPTSTRSSSSTSFRPPNESTGTSPIPPSVTPTLPPSSGANQPHRRQPPQTRRHISRAARRAQEVETERSNCHAELMRKAMDSLDSVAEPLPQLKELTQVEKDVDALGTLVTPYFQRMSAVVRTNTIITILQQVQQIADECEGVGQGTAAVVASPPDLNLLLSPSQPISMGLSLETQSLLGSQPFRPNLSLGNQSASLSVFDTMSRSSSNN